jgi:hypothetical protein
LRIAISHRHGCVRRYLQHLLGQGVGTKRRVAGSKNALYACDQIQFDTVASILGRRGLESCHVALEVEFSPERELLHQSERRCWAVHGNIAIIEVVGIDAKGWVRQRAGRRNPRCRGLGSQRSRSELGAEPPRKSSQFVDRRPGRFRLGRGRDRLRRRERAYGGNQE